MLGHELAIEQSEVSDLQAGHEPGQSDLGCVGCAAEHAFTEKGAAELHPVKAADERASLPHLDRMGVARAMERNHRLFELGVDPGFLTIGTSADHGGEVAVVRNLEPARPQG